MNKRLLLYVAVTIGVSAMLAVFVTLPDIKKVATVIMAFFGALTGFLVNLMMRTAQALEGQGLRASELQVLADLLKAQQRGWRSLFYLYLIVIIALLIISFSPDAWPVSVRGLVLDLSPVGTAIFGVLVSAALLRSLAMLSGIEALQELRARMLIEAAERREKEAREKAVAEVAYRPGPVNPNYGRTIPFPGAGAGS